MNRKTLSPIHLEDKRLAKRLAAGDESAFAAFFEHNYDRLYRFAITRLPNDEASVEDIVQQSFINALNRIDSYRGEAQLFTWLCTICRNQIIDWQRKHNKHQSNVVLIEDFPELQAVLESFQAPESDNPCQIAQREESMRLIQVVLDHLPINYGNVLEWRFIEGFSAKEVADRLGISIDATSSLTARAKRAFAELYQPLSKAVPSLLQGGI